MHRWDTVAIMGVGLIGGSIGLALRERKLARRVVGIGRSEASLARAAACGCISESATSIAQGVAEANVVVVCTPVALIAGQVAEAAACCPPGAVITDAGSTKGEIVAAAEAALLALENQEAIGGRSFVGSHPIAGGEKAGPEAARADLFVGRVCVVTPTSRTSGAALAEVEEFWQSLGSRLVRLSPEAHDAALARSSHLPHLVASALAAATAVEALPLTGSGWADTTRIAAGDVELWRQIFLSNRAGTLLALADFETVLKEFRSALESSDGNRLAELLAEGKRRRDAVGS
jgi:prephenate dehydrogenase